MKKIANKDELCKIATAAQISVANDRLDVMLDEINQVLDFCAAVGDFKNEENMEFSWTNHAETKLREDIPVEWVERDHFMENAPLREGDFFKAPQLMSEV